MSILKDDIPYDHNNSLIDLFKYSCTGRIYWRLDANIKQYVLRNYGILILAPLIFFVMHKGQLQNTLLITVTVLISVN